jgi:hypothetical protein
VWPGANVNLAIRGRARPLAVPIFFYTDPEKTREMLQIIVKEAGN